MFLHESAINIILRTSTFIDKLVYCRSQDRDIGFRFNVSALLKSKVNHAYKSPLWVRIVCWFRSHKTDGLLAIKTSNVQAHKADIILVWCNNFSHPAQCAGVNKPFVDLGAADKVMALFGSGKWMIHFMPLYLSTWFHCALFSQEQ